MAKKTQRANLNNVQVTFRMPKELYEKLEKIAISIYQSGPTVYRLALAEYAKNHRPARHGNSGISIVWPLEKPEDEAAEGELASEPSVSVDKDPVA